MKSNKTAAHLYVYMLPTVLEAMVLRCCKDEASAAIGTV